MVRARPVRDALTNALDFLRDSGLVSYAGEVAFGERRIGWHARVDRPFLLSGGADTVAQYLDWVKSGHYSAVMLDGALLQLAYRIDLGRVVGHRLALVPCPVRVDEDLLADGEPLLDVVEIHLSAQSVEGLMMRSQVRFDFDVHAAGDGHPASHMTVSGPNCRVPCVAPLHPYRFMDFVYRHFYPELWAGEAEWFEEASTRTLGQATIESGERDQIHLNWA